MKNTLLLILICLFSFSTTLKAQQFKRCYSNEDLSQDVGYVMIPNRLAILQKDLTLSSTKKLTKNLILEKIENQISTHNSKAPQGLALEIMKVSYYVGIDPFMFSSLILAESTFNPNAVSHTGALGLTQMTQIAFEELRDQFDVGDSKLESKSIDTLKKMVLGYLKTEAEVKKFIQFIASTKNPKNNKLVFTNKRYSLLSGALLFKIKLALTEGNYRLALRRYNGSPDQIPYANKILSAQRNLLKVNLNCSIDLKTEAILKLTCDLSEDDNFCQKYLGEITI